MRSDLLARRRLAEVAWTESDDGTFFVGALPDGPILKLEGPAASIFSVILDMSDVLSARGVVERLAREIDVPEDVLIAQVPEFIDELARSGVLGECP